MMCSLGKTDTCPSRGSSLNHTTISYTKNYAIPAGDIR